ncbi:MAG: hypothetical protein WCX61_00430 [Candidatus Peribacteraceae bacterium]
MKLLKERSVEVILLPVLGWIPFMRPPTIVAINGVGAIGMKRRNHGLLAQIARSFVELPLVSPRNPALLATFRTVGWRSKKDLLAIENRRDLVIEIQITLSDLEH